MSKSNVKPAQGKLGVMVVGLSQRNTLIDQISQKIIHSKPFFFRFFTCPFRHCVFRTFLVTLPAPPDFPGW